MNHNIEVKVLMILIHLFMIPEMIDSNRFRSRYESGTSKKKLDLKYIYYFWKCVEERFRFVIQNMYVRMNPLRRELFDKLSLVSYKQFLRVQQVIPSQHTRSDYIFCCRFYQF